MSADEIVAAVDEVVNSQDTGSYVCDDVVILKRSTYERLISARVEEAFAASDLNFAK